MPLPLPPPARGGGEFELESSYRPAGVLHRVQPVRARCDRGRFRRPYAAARRCDGDGCAFLRPPYVGRTARLHRRHGRRGRVGAGADSAGDGRTERAGRPAVLRSHAGGVGAGPAPCRPCRRCLLRAARRRPRDRRSRPRRHPADPGAPHRRSRHAGGRELRPARQRLGCQRRSGERLYRLPHQPASRHARARRRIRTGAAPAPRRHPNPPRAHPPADRAAHSQHADRQGRARTACTAR